MSRFCSNHFRSLCENGNGAKLLQYQMALVQQGINIPKSELKAALLFGCVSGELEIFQSLLNFYPSQTNKLHILLFRTACVSGQLEIANWLHDKDELSDAILEDIFIQTCRSGHVLVADWLLTTYPRNKIFLNDAFWLCYRCNLEMVEWLWKKSVDINPDIDLFVDPRFFNMACNFNNIEVVRWVLSLNPNTPISTDIFESSCCRGNLELSRLLWPHLACKSNIGK